MKAFLCKEFGPVDSHQVEEIDEPIAGPGQVVVDIKATGISFPDVLIVQGLYQFKPPFPFSPGSEISGVVSSVGEGRNHAQGRRQSNGQHRIRRLARKRSLSRTTIDAFTRNNGLQYGGWVST